jgi:hypothetical protein
MPPLTQHRIVLLCDFVCMDPAGRQRMLGLSVGDISASATLVHPDRRGNAKAMEARLFSSAEFVIGDDLHPAVAAQFMDGAASWSTGRRVSSLKLSPQGLDLVNGRTALPVGDLRDRPGYQDRRGFALQIGTAKAPFEAVLRVTDFEVLHFASGVGVALVTLAWASEEPLTLGGLFALMSRLTPNRTADVLGWAHVAEDGASDRFSLSWLMSRILAPAVCSFEVWSRIFTHVYAVLPAGTDDGALSDAAWRLSRHYSPAYRAEPGWPGTELYGPFTDIRHGLSLEGAATVASESSAFVANGGLMGRMGNCYLPLALLAYHEHAYLLDIAQEAARVPSGDDPAAQARSLRDLTDRFLLFRLRYRLPLASDITMHNAFYERMRRALQIEALEAKLGQDVTEAQGHLRRLADDRAAERAAAAAAEAGARAQREAAAAHLQEEAYKQRERARAPMLGLFAGLLTYLTSSAAFKDIKVLLPPHLKPGDLFWFAVAAGLALLAGWLTTRRHGDEHRAGASGHGHHGGHAAHHLDEERRQEGVNAAAKAVTAAAALPRAET